MLGFKPVIVQVNAPDDVHDPRAVPLVSVAVAANAEAVYSVMVSPPLEAGNDQATVAAVPLKVPAAFVGASGVEIGVTETVEELAP